MLLPVAGWPAPGRTKRHLPPVGAFGWLRRPQPDGPAAPRAATLFRRPTACARERAAAGRVRKTPGLARRLAGFRAPAKVFFPACRLPGHDEFAHPSPWFRQHDDGRSPKPADTGRRAGAAAPAAALHPPVHPRRGQGRRLAPGRSCRARGKLPPAQARGAGRGRAAHPRAVELAHARPFSPAGHRLRAGPGAAGAEPAAAGGLPGLPGRRVGGTPPGLAAARGRPPGRPQPRGAREIASADAAALRPGLGAPARPDPAARPQPV